MPRPRLEPPASANSAKTYPNVTNWPSVQDTAQADLLNSDAEIGRRCDGVDETDTRLPLIRFPFLSRFVFPRPPPTQLFGVRQHGEQFCRIFETLVAAQDEYNKAKVGRTALLDAVYKDVKPEAARIGETVDVYLPTSNPLQAINNGILTGASVNPNYMPFMLQPGWRRPPIPGLRHGGACG